MRYLRTTLLVTAACGACGAAAVLAWAPAAIGWFAAAFAVTALAGAVSGALALRHHGRIGTGVLAVVVVTALVRMLLLATGIVPLRSEGLPAFWAWVAGVGGAFVPLWIVELRALARNLPAPAAARG